MSVPNATKALEIAQKVKLERKRLFEQEIDSDVQLLKERAENLVRSIEPDSKGYWGFKVKLSEISYKTPQTVIDQFSIYMKSIGYAIPDIPFQKNWWKPNSYYAIRFRPKDGVDDVNLM